MDAVQVSRRQSIRHLGANQEIQRVFIQCHRLRQSSNVHLGSIHLCLRAMKIQLGNESTVKAFFNQIIRRLLCLKGRVRQCEVLPIRGQEQIGVGNFGHQQNLCAASGLFRGQVFLPRLIRQATDATEEVDLPGTEAKVNSVLLDDSGLPGGRKISRHPLFASAGDGIDHREQFSSLDPIQCAGPLHIQCGQPQIAVVLQSHLNDPQKLLVGEELLSFQLRRIRRGGRWPTFPVCRSTRPVARDWSFWSSVFRRHRAPAQHKDQSDQ